MTSSPAPNGYPTTLARRWLSLLLRLAGSQHRAQTPVDIARLNRQLTLITAVRAGSGVADLAPLAVVVAPARAFTTLALEVDYGWGEILNEYIKTGAGDSLTVHQAVGSHI
jgi:hypothetical protein